MKDFDLLKYRDMSVTQIADSLSTRMALALDTGTANLNSAAVIGLWSTVKSLIQRGLVHPVDRRWTRRGWQVAAYLGFRVHTIDQLHEIATAAMATELEMREAHRAADRRAAERSTPAPLTAPLRHYVDNDLLPLCDSHDDASGALRLTPVIEHVTCDKCNTRLATTGEPTLSRELPTRDESRRATPANPAPAPPSTSLAPLIAAVERAVEDLRREADVSAEARGPITEREFEARISTQPIDSLLRLDDALMRGIVAKARRDALSSVLSTLDGWIEVTRENHGALEHRGEPVGQECWRQLAVQDVRDIVASAATWLGIRDLEAGQ